MNVPILDFHMNCLVQHLLYNHALMALSYPSNLKVNKGKGKKQK